MTSFQDFQDRIDEFIFGFIDDNGNPDCLNHIEDMIYWEAKRVIDYSIRHHIQQELDEFEMNLTRVRDGIDKINDLKCDIDVYKYVIGPCGEHGVIGSKVFWGIERACSIAHFVKEELSAT